MTAEERFWRKVDRSGGSTACWLWTRGRSGTGGYGMTTLGGHRIGAHRAAWILKHGRISRDLLVCHDCPGGDNPLCVNPAHLWLGTHSQNTNDAVRKGACLGQRGSYKGVTVGISEWLASRATMVKRKCGNCRRPGHNSQSCQEPRALHPAVGL